MIPPVFTVELLSVRSVRVVVAASLLALLVGVRPAAAQTPAPNQALTVSLFERYLDSLREQAAIPGLSFAVIQNGKVWAARGLGKQDVESNTAATVDTPYNIAGLSQTVGAAMLLRTCLEEGTLELGDRVVRWLPHYPDQTATIRQLLSHTSAGQFAYDLDRFAVLTDVLAECTGMPYGRTIADRLFQPFGMTSSVPGADFTAAASPALAFTEPTVQRFNAVVRRVAVSYRMERGRAVRSDVPPARLSASTGVISTVADLERFSRILETGVLVLPRDLDASWTQVQVLGTSVPAGLGWFVQNHKGEPLVWQFGQIKDGHSALLLKLPARGLTFIALANSDVMTAPYDLQAGDAEASPFAALFLKFFVP